LRIVRKFGIDVEENGHIYFLVWVEALLLEAEALDFVEILTDLCVSIAGERDHLERKNIVSRNACNSLICGILRSEESKCGFARDNLFQ
jgi:hypothetical protein